MQRYPLFIDWKTQSPKKIPSKLLCGDRHTNSKFIWEEKISRMLNTILKKNKVERLMLPNFKTNYNQVI